MSRIKPLPGVKPQPPGRADNLMAEALTFHSVMRKDGRTLTARERADALVRLAVAQRSGIKR